MRITRLTVGLGAEMLIILVLCASIAMLAQAPSIPPGPPVLVFGDEYHVAACPKLSGRTPKEMSLVDAMRAGAGPCPVCEPNAKNPAVGAFARNYAVAIGRELAPVRAEARRAKAEAERAAVMRAVEAELRSKNLWPVKSDCSPAEVVVRTITNNLLVKYAKFSDLIDALDVAVGVDPGSALLPGYAIVSSSDALFIAAMFPYDTYRTGLLEANRKREPIDLALFPRGVQIAVSPRQIGSPDIVKVIVERDGVEIAPISSSLVLTQMETSLGAKRMVHSGAVMFPCSAFAPGAKVVVTAIPDVGSNLVLSFSQEQLGRLK